MDAHSYISKIVIKQWTRDNVASQKKLKWMKMRVSNYPSRLYVYGCMWERIKIPNYEMEEVRIIYMMNKNVGSCYNKSLASHYYRARYRV